MTGPWAPNGGPQVRRDGQLRRAVDDTITVPLTVTPSGGDAHPAALNLTVAEAELLHAQLTRALSPPVILPPSPWLGSEPHDDVSGRS